MCDQRPVHLASRVQGKALEERQHCVTEGLKVLCPSANQDGNKWQQTVPNKGMATKGWCP